MAYLINKKMSKSEKKNAIINALDIAYADKTEVNGNEVCLTKDYFVFSEDGNKVELRYCIPDSNFKSEMVMTFNRKYNYITVIADIICSHIE